MTTDRAAGKITSIPATSDENIASRYGSAGGGRLEVVAALSPGRGKGFELLAFAFPEPA